MSNGANGETTLSRWTFTRQVSIGNIIAVITMLVTVLFFYVRATQHIADSQLHQTQTEKELLIDNRVELHLKPIRERMDAQHDEVMRAITRLERIQEKEHP
jgi:hypothetical protein